MKETIRHASVALLLALGLTLSVMGCMGLLAWALPACVTAFATVALLAVCSIKRRGQWLAVGLVLAGNILWVLLLGGMSTAMEIIQAITLHFSGVNGALPMVAVQLALWLGVLMGLACFCMTGLGLGGYPAMAATVLAGLMLWLADRPDVLPWLTPAVAALLMQSASGRQGELSLPRCLPLAGVLAAMALMLTPQEGVTIQPMKDAADYLREQILARFMFTQPRNVFTLATEGYYPQGQNQLGGKAEPNDHPVMLVKTTRKTYLRGSVKNEYTGRSWLDTMAGRRYLWSSLQWRDLRTDTFNMALPQGALGENSGLTAYQTVSVKMLDKSASSMFVPQRIRSLNPGGELVPYFNSGSEVFVTRDLQEGDTYTVTAPLMQAGDAGLGTLISACAATADPLYPQILSDYTILPDHLQEQVFQIAQEAIAGAQTPYDKAYAIQTFLSRSFNYTLDVDPQPENLDFVSTFLLSTREGYCTHFASAMTVLCRMAGLPARYVEGYLAEPDASGHAYVTGMHGHAWTEVYFAGFGWLTFDATPAQNRASEPPEDMLPPETDEPEDTIAPPEEEPTATPAPEKQPEEQDSPTPAPKEPDAPNQEPENPAKSSLNWLWLLLLLLLLAAACAGRILWVQPARCAKRAKDEMGRWSAWMQAVSDVLNASHLSREKSESPMAYMGRMDSLRRFAVKLLPLGECMALVFYGRLEPEPEETAMAADAYRQMLPQLTCWQRLRLTFVRAFVPEKKRAFTR